MVQSLDTRYDTLQQHLFVRANDLTYTQLTDLIRRETHRIDLDSSTRQLYSAKAEAPAGKTVCTHCLSLGFTRHHDVSQCYTKYPHLRPAAKEKAAPAKSSGPRAPDPNSKRSQKTLRAIQKFREDAKAAKAPQPAAAAATMTNKHITAEPLAPSGANDRTNWHIHTEPSESTEYDVHALRQQLPRANTIEFEADSGSQGNYAPTPAHLQNYHGAGHDGHTIVCALNSRSPTEGVGSLGNIMDKVYVNHKIAGHIMSIPDQYLHDRATLFHPQHGVIITRAEDMDVSYRNVIASGALRNGTFKVDVPIEPAPVRKLHQLTAAEKTEAKAQMQLARLGYPGPARIVQMARDPSYHLDLPTNISVDAFKVDQNDVYQLAKSREQPHRNFNMHITAKQPFEKIHVDCITMPIVGYGGVKYTMVVTCDYSAWTYSTNLVSRDQVPDALKTWIKTFVEPLNLKCGSCVTTTQGSRSAPR